MTAPKGTRIAAFFSVALGVIAMGMPAISEPISLRGIDWSMPIDEQIEALEKEGLDCVREVGWNAFFWSPISSSKNNVENPLPLCFLDQGEGANVETLRQAYEDWDFVCSQTALLDPACHKHKYKELRDRLRMVWFQDGGAVIFECEFLNSCGYAPAEVMEQLQRQVINANFQKLADSSLVCAKGEDGDSICYHLISHAIWLFQNPAEGAMKF